MFYCYYFFALITVTKVLMPTSWFKKLTPNSFTGKGINGLAISVLNIFLSALLFPLILCLNTYLYLLKCYQDI